MALRFYAALPQI